MSTTFKKDARYAWFAIGAAVLALVVFIVWHRTANAPTDNTDVIDEIISDDAKPYLESTYPHRVPLSVPEGPALFVENNEVRVKDQTAGEKVFLSQVSFMQSGWVAVRDVVDGAYGNILGAARFDTGVWQGEVLLLRPTVPGNNYVAVMYADDGDGVFDHQKDSLILSEDAPVGMFFSVY